MSRARHFSRATVPYDLKQLDVGCIVEQEHTPDRFKACKIARDHLHEDPKYYTRLCNTWPKEKGCDILRSPTRHWPIVAGLVGLGMAWYAVWSARKS